MTYRRQIKVHFKVESFVSLNRKIRKTITQTGRKEKNIQSIEKKIEMFTKILEFRVNVLIKRKHVYVKISLLYWSVNTELVISRLLAFHQLEYNFSPISINSRKLSKMISKKCVFLLTFLSHWKKIVKKV